MAEKNNENTGASNERFVDIEDGIRRASGNRELYVMLWGHFVEQCEHGDLQIRSAIEAKDSEQARATTHSIKIAAGSLGATRLHDVAVELEAALSSGADAHELELKYEQFSDLVAGTLEEGHGLTQPSSSLTLPPLDAKTNEVG